MAHVRKEGKGGTEKKQTNDESSCLIICEDNGDKKNQSAMKIRIIEIMTIFVEWMMSFEIKEGLMVVCRGTRL